MTGKTLSGQTTNRGSIKKTVSFHAQAPEHSDETSSWGLEFFSSDKSIFAVQFHLLLILYILLYSGLTNDPFQIMVKGLVSLFMLQFAYGMWLIKSDTAQADHQRMSGNISSCIQLVFKSMTIALCLANFMFVAIILLGAPLSELLGETYILACHISIIVFQPILISCRLNINGFTKVFMHQHPFRVIFGNQILSASFLAALGSWFGVLPIPLDWDRPWQQWPITILVGAYAGGFAGSFLTLFL